MIVTCQKQVYSRILTFFLVFLFFKKSYSFSSMMSSKRSNVDFRPAKKTAFDLGMWLDGDGGQMCAVADIADIFDLVDLDDQCSDEDDGEENGDEFGYEVDDVEDDDGDDDASGSDEPSIDEDALDDDNDHNNPLGYVMNVFGPCFFQI